MSESAQSPPQQLIACLPAWLHAVTFELMMGDVDIAKFRGARGLGMKEKSKKKYFCSFPHPTT